MQRQPEKISSAISTGIAGHTLLEAFYKAVALGASKEDSWRQAQNALPKKKTPEMLVAYVLVQNYIDDLNIKGTVITVERSFVVDVAPGLAIGFTPDLIWHYNDKRIEVEDYKFIQRAWAAKKINRYSQLDVYRGLLRMNDLDVKRGVLRFFNTGTSPGKITHKIYDDNVKLDRVMVEFIRAAHKVKAFKDLSLEEQNELAGRTFNYNTCTYCFFELPCTLELSGSSAAKTLETQYKPLEYGYGRRFQD